MNIDPEYTKRKRKERLDLFVSVIMLLINVFCNISQNKYLEVSDCSPVVHVTHTSTVSEITH